MNDNKIFVPIADNDSNFFKAFKTFGVYSECITIENNVEFLRIVTENNRDKEESLSTNEE